MFLVLPRFRIRVSVFALPSLLVMLWLEGLLPFLILMLSALVHEVGHIIAIRALGYRARRIDILPMGALIVCPEGVPYLHETVIALAGPVFSLSASAVVFCMYLITSDVYLFFAAFVNLLLGAFNLMPIEKLDGGKALCCFLLYKNKESCEKISSAASLTFEIFVFAVAAAAIITSGCNPGAVLLSASLLLQL